MKGIGTVLAMVILFALVAGCAAPTPAVVEKKVVETQVVEKQVVQTQVVEKTVVVEKQVEVTKVVEKQVVAQPTAETCAKPKYVLTAPLIHPYITNWAVGGEAAAKELNVELVYLTAAEYNPQRQLELTESSLSLPCVEGVSVMTGDPNILEGVVKTAMGKGLGVTQSGACPDTGAAPVCMATNFKEAAKTMAAHLAKLLNNKGNVVVFFGVPGNEVHQQTVDAYKEYFTQNAPDIKVIGQVNNCDDPQGTVKCAEEALSQFPQMNAIITTGNLGIVGAAQVFPKAKRDDIVMAGIDDAPEVIDAITKGANAFTYAQQPFGQGYLQVYIPWLMKHKGLKPTQHFLDTRITIVDKSNVGTYKEVVKTNFDELKKYVETELMK